MSIDFILQQPGCWLRGEGDESDIVISSRIRLARNLSGFPFIARANAQDRENIQAAVQNIIPDVFSPQDVEHVDISDAEPLDRQFLQERQLISAELVGAKGARSVVIDREERFSVMINEEDHLRIQALKSGFSVGSIWTEIDSLDEEIGDRIEYAFSEKYGFLTACPTNVGTGMRVSVMLHLPALVATKEIEKVFRSLQKVSLAVRGMYGEGSQALGDLFQISNQITLSVSEENILKRVCDIIPQIISYERQAREHLLTEKHESICDRTSRALGVLSTARTIGSEEAMHHLSSIRLGVNTKLLDFPSISVVNDLLLHVQPAHLQKLVGATLSQSERDIERARYLRQRLSN